MRSTSLIFVCARAWARTAVAREIITGAVQGWREANGNTGVVMGWIGGGSAAFPHDDSWGSFLYTGDYVSARVIFKTRQGCIAVLTVAGSIPFLTDRRDLPLGVIQRSSSTRPFKQMNRPSDRQYCECTLACFER